MFKLLSILFLSVLATTSIYTYTATSLSGSTIRFSDFQHKKIMIVNIATGSPRINQLAGLQQLQAQFGDSLVVVAFPSNSFGKESRTDAEIKNFCELVYHTTFPVAQKGAVIGSGTQPVFQWLGSQGHNGVMDAAPKQDFFKWLISEQGELIAVYAGAVEPMDPTILEAIHQQY